MFHLQSPISQDVRHKITYSWTQELLSTPPKPLRTIRQLVLREPEKAGPVEGEDIEIAAGKQSPPSISDEANCAVIHPADGCTIVYLSRGDPTPGC